MDTEALRISWSEVAANGEAATKFFYSHLFVTHPELREMFPIHMTAQRSRFFTAMCVIITDVDRLAIDSSFVEQLGRDHRRFGTIAEHFLCTRDSLLATLEHFLGERWTPYLQEAWIAAYDVIARLMIDAAASVADTPAYWDAEIVASTRLTLDVTVHTVRPTQPYPFHAGQFLAVEIPQRPREWRYFSPSSAPRPDGTLDLQVQIVDGGQVSGYFAREMGPGDGIRIGSPIGTEFVIDPTEADPLLLIAGGSGLAPMRAIIDAVDRHGRTTGRARRVHLFHGARTEWDIYDDAALTDLARQPWFSYTPVVSDDPGYSGVTGLVGAVAASAADWTGYTAMVCGSAAMVAATVEQLRRVGMPLESIRFEKYGDFTVPGGVVTSGVGRHRAVSPLGGGSVIR
ncbi:globin domain-containing protein [Nocardia stercoris]|uniref:nitric oxide dioxygenase n=1 Tax=Nocardia stercoris TaxID=2483361 RepID=A0A3M2LD85_9NOCA|nr:globin domain-containing protein [Nocardia stercoris]RMI35489.1 oxidoreductase [Nocardia stercoris]